MLRTHRRIRHPALTRTSRLTRGPFKTLALQTSLPLPPQQTCMHTRGAMACRRALWVRRDQERSQNGHVRAEAAAVRRCWATPHGMCSWCRSAADGMGHDVNGLHAHLPSLHDHAWRGLTIQQHVPARRSAASILLHAISPLHASPTTTHSHTCSGQLMSSPRHVRHGSEARRELPQQRQVGKTDLKVGLVVFELVVQTRAFTPEQIRTHIRRRPAPSYRSCNAPTRGSEVGVCVTPHE